MAGAGLRLGSEVGPKREMSYRCGVSFELLKCSTTLSAHVWSVHDELMHVHDFVRECTRMVAQKTFLLQPARVRLARELFASAKIECVAISEPVRYCAQNLSVERRIITS